MYTAQTLVPAPDLDILVLAVDRLDYLQNLSHTAPAAIDPARLLDALCDVFEASSRLINSIAPEAHERS